MLRCINSTIVNTENRMLDFWSTVQFKVQKAMSEKDKEDKLKEAATYAAGGAAAGAGVAATVGGMGLAVGGTAVAIGAAPVVAAGAVIGLAAYGIKKLFD
jgi:hypothetical protein